MPGARFENDATTSDGGSVVAPTLTAEPMHAGAATAFVRPSLPEATTVATPLARKSAIRAASAGKLRSHGIEYPPLPRLRLIAAIFGNVVSSVSRTYREPASWSDG